MEQKILEIVKKIRRMYRFDDRINDIIQNNPIIDVEISEDGTSVTLKCISWKWYNKLSVTENNITLHLDRGACLTILKYNGWDELIAL